jgi:SAM-dependent methyltransferase
MSADSIELRESYRERLYRHYLANLQGTDLLTAQQRAQTSVPYFKRSLKYLPQNKDAKILDLGCGTGNWLYLLKQEGYLNLEGVDRSPEQVAAAHVLGLDFVKQGDVREHLISRKSASCDVVLVLDVIEHLSKDEALEFVDQVFRVLAPGGVMVVHLPNGEGIFSGCVAFGDFTHELILTNSSLSQLLRCVGFSEIQSFEDTPVVHGFFSACRFVVWMIGRTAFRILYLSEYPKRDRNLILSQNFLSIARK